MKLVLQRVSRASVAVGGRITGEIAHGLVVFLCVEKGDDTKLARHYAEKVAHLRIFNDDQGKMNRSLMDVGGEALLISQFTLAADAEKGRRPSFDAAAAPEPAKELYEFFGKQLELLGVRVASGVFQAMMQVELVNDGPVTILLGKQPVELQNKAK